MNGGHRDDRIEKPDPETGELKPYNGVAHSACNMLKGSRRMSYNKRDQVSGVSKGSECAASSET